MIIRYPTGLYVRQIPQSPSDSGNVTFVISNEEPETSGIDFILLPWAERIKKRYDKIYNDDQRRVSMGSLIYTVTSVGNTVNDKSVKLFEVGQNLEFSDTELEVDVDAVPSRMELQHNTNLLDLNSLGLTDSEISALSKDSVATKTELEAQLTSLQNKISDNKASVVNLQKTMNEADKAMQAILSMPEDHTDIYNKIKATRDNAYTNQQILIEEINISMEESVIIRNKIASLSQLVR